MTLETAPAGIRGGKRLRPCRLGSRESCRGMARRRDQGGVRSGRQGRGGRATGRWGRRAAGRSCILGRSAVESSGTCSPTIAGSRAHVPDVNPVSGDKGRSCLCTAC